MIKFEHTIKCPVRRDFVWKFWTNVDNWSVVDPAVEWVKLEGAFTAGTKGFTKPLEMPTNAWKLKEVDDGKRAIIEIEVPGAVVNFIWNFTDTANGGTQITQKVILTGEQIENYAKAMDGLKQGIPAGMEKLAAGIINDAGRKQKH
jgi:hypothetical protein